MSAVSISLYTWFSLYLSVCLSVTVHYVLFVCRINFTINRVGELNDYVTLGIMPLKCTIIDTRYHSAG